MEQKLIDDILSARNAALDAARPGMVADRHADGRLTARERIDLLVDDGSFLEYGVLVEASAESPGEGPADGMVCGVCDCSCYLALNCSCCLAASSSRCPYK